jgi:hypothetical protein
VPARPEARSATTALRAFSLPPIEHEWRDAPIRWSTVARLPIALSRRCGGQKHIRRPMRVAALAR